MTKIQGPYGIQLTTDFHANGVIEQSVTDITGQIFRTVLDTRERHVREALEALGWTPPGSKAAQAIKAPPRKTKGPTPTDLQAMVLRILEAGGTVDGIRGLTVKSMAEVAQVAESNIRARLETQTMMRTRGWVRMERRGKACQWFITPTGIEALGRYKG